MSTEEYKQRNQINRSLLEDAMKSPEFDIVVFERQLDRLKKEKKLKMQLRSVLKDEGVEDFEATAERVFDYLDYKGRINLSGMETPNARDL